MVSVLQLGRCAGMADMGLTQGIACTTGCDVFNSLVSLYLQIAVVQCYVRGLYVPHVRVH